MLQFDAKITHISIISMKKLNSHFLKLYKLFYTKTHQRKFVSSALGLK